MGAHPIRAQLRGVLQPALTLVLTLVVAALLIAPPTSWGGASSATPTSQPESGSRSLALPGQGTPGNLAPLAGPGYPAGDARVVRIRSAGRERGYLLLPALGLAPGQRAGLVVVLHQDVGSAQAVAEGLGLDSLRRAGVTLAYPAGIDGSWNAGDCCGVARRDAVDDVAFVDTVLSDVGHHVPVDPGRRALVGYSGGGMLIYRLLCGVHPALVAVVEVNGSLEAPCPDTVRLPDLLAVHGARDGTVGLSQPIFVTRLGIAPRPALSTLAMITRLAGCAAASTATLAGMRDVRWRGCRGGSTVELQIVTAAGHGWESVGGAARALPFLASHLLAAL